MKLTYDPQGDALYLRITDTEVDDTIEEEDGTIIDYDIEGKIVGVEILSASKRVQYLTDDATIHDTEKEQYGFLRPRPAVAA